MSVGGSDFLSFLSSHCPHLSADAAKDFASGSSVLLSTLRSSSTSVSDPPATAPGALPPSLFSSAIPPGGVAFSRVLGVLQFLRLLLCLPLVSCPLPFR